MQMPMEISSLMMTQAGFGTGARQKAGFSLQDGFGFINAMEIAYVNVGTKLSVREKKSDTTMVEKDAMPKEPKKSEKDKIADGALAAGAMGSQNPVVIILEGDKESATTLDICADIAAPSLSDATVNQAETETGPFMIDTIDFEPAEEETDLITAQGATDEKVFAYTADAGNVQETVAKEEDTGIIDQKKAAVQNTVNDADNSDSTTGDVTARMPIARTSERHEKEGDDPDFSGEGNLGPLENENNEAPVKGQKGKAYSSIADEVKNAAKGMPEPVNNTSAPLAEGIKPEQFRAEQQMRQTIPVKTENLLSEMISRIETMKGESQSTVSIQLKPEFLGKVALEIAMDATGLHVKINAADSGVRAMINGQINTLIESLENKGIEVVEVEVTYTGIDNGTFKEPREGQAQPNRSQQPYHETESADVAAYYSVLPFEMLDYYIDTGVSSVEYRA